MSVTVHSLELPTFIRTAAERLAERDGVSLDQWIAAAVAEKVGAAETAAEFFRRRARGATADDLGRVLAKVGCAEPEPEDALPPDLRARLARPK